MQQTSKWQTPLPELLLEALRKHNSLSDNCYPSDVQANSYPHQGTRGGGMESLPGVFDVLQYFETILPLVESL